MVTQATSPLFSTKAFWSIKESISYDEKDNYMVYPYHVYIPSFGEWGFVMSTKSKIHFDDLQTKVKADYFSKETFKTALKFSKDIKKIEVEPNRLSNHLLLKYYDEGWEKWY
jgi:spermidine synthase